MKYKLLKELPLADIGDEVEYFETTTEIRKKGVAIAYLHKNLISEWLEEVKEPKTIYDLNIGDFHYFLDIDGEIRQVRLYDKKDIDILSDFITEREAKRNKLLRELATRTDKFFPEKQENYIAIGFQGEASNSNWMGCPFEYADYHNGLVFRNVEEYNKYMTEETKDLLFNI